MDGSMTPRMDLNATLPEGYKAVIALDRAAAAGVDPTIGELVKVRASMLNGCAFCLDMHTTDAVGAGEDLRRLMAVAAWRESPYFTPAERAALALTDELTRLGEHGVTDEVWAELGQHFDEEQVAHLLLAISVINVWNRVAVATHKQPAGLADDPAVFYGRRIRATAS
jgi:AhpD family alkylhydroperoxidase